MCNQIQQTELEIFKEFKGICDRHHLKYFAIGGTCIGAVRHKGFIPWDDDIDVAMPYLDYKKFQQIALMELSGKYSLYTPKDHRHYLSIHTKIHNIYTTFIETEKEKYEDDYSGVFMDIMPIFGMPKGRLLQCLASIFCDGLLFLNQIHRGSFEQKTKLQKIGWLIDTPIRKLRSFNYYVEVIEKIFGKYSFNNSNKILFGWRRRPKKRHPEYTYQNVFYYDDFKETIEYPFEDASIAIPRGYDRYLTMDFGDYMKLPPKEKRIQHKTIAIDLNKSYKDYIKEKHSLKEKQ